MFAISRSSYFAFVLALSLLPALSFAQTPPIKPLSTASTSPSKDTVLFDFEGGNFDGWTLTGDCWDKAPATPKTFVDKGGQPLVSGIVGNGYLTTLFKNATTTGKAISKEFMIDKPFLTFKIGGGRYPKEACLNLLVDGKIVRTETGFDSAELVSVTWDVSLLAGKIAHLEIIDSTANPNRGYVMVDDLRLSDIHPEDRYDNRYPFTNYQRQNTLRFRDLPLSVQPIYYSAVKNIYFQLSAQQMRFHYGEKFEDIVKRIRMLSEQTSEAFSISDTLTKQLLTAETACGWVRHNIHYYLRPQEERGKGNRTASILREQQPKCDCSGFSRLTYDLGRALGLKCEHAGGTLRRAGLFNGEKDTHGWVIFSLEGKSIPADPTTALKYYGSGNVETNQDVTSFRSNLNLIKNYDDGSGLGFYGKTDGGNCLPLTRAEWEVFCAIHYTHYYYVFAPKEQYSWLEEEPLLKINWEIWRDNTPTHFRDLQQKLLSSDIARNKAIILKMR